MINFKWCCICSAFSACSKCNLVCIYIRRYGYCNYVDNIFANVLSLLNSTSIISASLIPRLTHFLFPRKSLGATRQALTQYAFIFAYYFISLCYAFEVNLLFSKYAKKKIITQTNSSFFMSAHALNYSILTQRRVRGQPIILTGLKIFPV